MATLSTADRQRIWRGFMRYVSNIRQPLAVTKPELQAAVDATDDWIDANAASYNAALPDAFRNGATAGQKAMLFCVVAAMRFAPGFVTKLLGGLD